jgi:hypothetical protein
MDNFAVLDGRGWQAHVYGEAAPGIAEACRERDVALHVFPWQTSMHRSGLRRNALYVVRPDGYVALASADAAPAELTRYMDALFPARR